MRRSLDQHLRRPRCGRRCARSTRTSRPPATARCAPRCSASTASRRAPDDLRVSDAELDGAGAATRARAARRARQHGRRPARLQRARAARRSTGARRSHPAWSSASARARSPRPRIYVPCGKGSFPSVMAHLGVPAAVAGVPRVVVLCPPLRSTGRVDPAYLYIAAQLGLREVWRVNGPTGIAAAALGSVVDPARAQGRRPGQPCRDRGAAAGRRARRDDEHAAGPEREPDHRRRLGRSRAAGAAIC